MNPVTKSGEEANVPSHSWDPGMPWIGYHNSLDQAETYFVALLHLALVDLLSKKIRHHYSVVFRPA